MRVRNAGHQEKLQNLSDSYLTTFIEKLESKLNKPIEEIVIDNYTPQGEIESIFFCGDVPEIDALIFEESYKDNGEDIDKWCGMIYSHLSDSPASKVKFICEPTGLPYLFASSHDKGVCFLSSYGIMFGENKCRLSIIIQFVVVDKPIGEIQDAREKTKHQKSN